MSAWWIQLLLALLAAGLRSGATEGDPLPAALVELVRNSPISSIEDLNLLLLTDSVDEEVEGSPANGGHRLPRSLDAQPAQQALCKVRTEVVEVTRAMLDRSNANFLLWPPCVEVQRCSGCCNTKSLQCVPVLTHIRYLQVMKIQYVNKRPTYAKAVVSVVDHVECRCQPALRPPAPRKKSSNRRQQNHHKDQHGNQTLGLGHGQGKVRSKEELHHQEEGKQHQRDQLEELLEQHWTPRGDTFKQPRGEGREGHSPVREEASWSGEKATHHGPHWVRNATRLLGSKDGLESRENAEGRVEGRFSGGNRTLSSKDVTGAGFGLGEKDNRGERGGGLLVNSTTREGRTEGRQRGGPSHSEANKDKDGEIQRHIAQTDSSRLSKSQNNDSSEQAGQNPRTKLNISEATNQGDGNTFRPTKEPNPNPRIWDVAAGRQRENETPEEERRLKMEEEKLEEEEEEKKELLLLHKRLDQEKEALRQQQQRTGEGREREEEREGQRHHHTQHHHQKTTTQITETASPTSTQPPSVPAGPRPPPGPARPGGG